MSLITKKAYLIDTSYTVRNGKTYISLILKGKKKTVKLYYRYDPYFYVDAPEGKENELLAISAQRKFGGIAKPIRVELVDKHVGLKKKKLAKIYCQEPSDVPVLKGSIPFQCFEYNIPFSRRFIFDNHLTPFCILTYERESKKREIKKIISVSPGQPILSTFAFDIETYNPLGMPLESKDPAVMISYATEKRKGVLTFKKSQHSYVETLSGEKEMLERFSQIVQEENPDVLAGYNSANFDLPYLKTRAERTKASFKLGRFGKQFKEFKVINKGNVKGMRLDGRVHFDLFPLVKFFSFIGLIKSQNMSLDSVSEDVLKKKKVKMNKDDIWKQWDSNDIDKLCEYSLVDSELAYELSGRFLPLETELSSVAKMPLFDTSLSSSGQLVENLLMYHATEKNILIPSKPGGDTISERLDAPIQGAFVKLPEPGIYENIAVLDFRGLYPSIIISYNIDPGTLVSNDEVPINGCHISPSEAKFSKGNFGLIPFVLDYLVDLRGKIKDDLKLQDKSSDDYTRLSARSHALKILANSFYGYMGYARSRWYSRPCAESVTAWGRKHIMETIETAEKFGFQVLYSDTDSVFIIYKNKQDVMDFMNNINESLPEKMELELEGFYPRGVFVSKRTGGSSSGDGEDGESTGAKKKYALLGEDGRTKIRGFELVRRDWSSVAKDTQLKVLEAILKEGSKEKAAKIIRDMVTQLKEGKMPLEKLAISTQITKDPSDYDIVSPETTAAKKLIKAGIRVERGSIIAYVIGRSGKTISEKAEPLELAKDYDTEYYINNQVLPAVMKIMKELGYDEYSLIVGGKQKGLSDFL